MNVEVGDGDGRQETGDGLSKCCSGLGFPLSGDKGVSEGRKIWEEGEIRD